MNAPERFATAQDPAAPAAEISAADRVLQVLAVLACADRALSAADLMQRTGLPRSSLYRQLARLKRFGFVAEHGGSYAPGPLGLQLARGFDDGSHLVQVARPILVQLTEQTRESAGLLVAANGQAVCLDMVESPQSLRCSFVNGLPARCAARRIAQPAPWP